MHEAKTQLSRLVRRAELGEDVLIARGSVVVARLTRVEASTPGRRFGSMRGRARVTPAFFEPLPAGELDGWE